MIGILPMRLRNILLLCLVISLGALASCMRAENAIIKPFVSDGCSAFPDGTFADNRLWQGCCVTHDKAYWQGGSYQQRLAADKVLKQCVTAIGKPNIAKLMLAGVRVGGSPHWPTKFRWGYGWSYPHGYDIPQLPALTHPIIDMHVHTAGLGYGDSGCFVSDALQDSYKFDIYIKAFGASKADMEAHGDQIVIRRIADMLQASEKVDGAVILAMDGVINADGELDREKTQVYIPNDFVATETARYPELYFGASINPYRHDALARLDAVKAQGAKLIKWIPNIQHIDPADEKLIPFYNKMIALDLPLLSHTGQERSFDEANDAYGDPERLALPLSLGVTVIAGHIATTGESDEQSNYARILPMFAKYPNLYTDISSLTQINKLGYLKTALAEPKLNGRLLYGSDFPLINMILVSPYYFPFDLSFKQMRQLSKIENPLDQDVSLKQTLGVPVDVFSRSAALLGITDQKD